MGPIGNWLIGRGLPVSAQPILGGAHGVGVFRDEVPHRSSYSNNANRVPNPLTVSKKGKARKKAEGITTPKYPKHLFFKDLQILTSQSTQITKSKRATTIHEIGIFSPKKTTPTSHIAPLFVNIREQGQASIFTKSAEIQRKTPQ